MTVSVHDKRAAFRALHERGCFVLPNPWDVGSAIALQHLGFKAIASTSAGMAWSMGRKDNAVGLEDALAHLAALSGAVDIPLNADFENGFADEPHGVAANVSRAAGAGVAGLSIEDSTGKAEEPLYDFELAVARVAAARKAIDASNSGVVLTARCESFLIGRPDLDEVLRRLKAYAEAGADCLYAPLIMQDDHIRAVVQAVAPRPVNVLAFGPPVSHLASLGARRVSIGGSLAKAAWAGFLTAARQIADEGSFEGLKAAAAAGDLNALFPETGRG
jgi:methylisocitrate lyase